MCAQANLNGGLDRNTHPEDPALPRRLLRRSLLLACCQLGVLHVGSGLGAVPFGTVAAGCCSKGHRRLPVVQVVVVVVPIAVVVVVVIVVSNKKANIA